MARGAAPVHIHVYSLQLISLLLAVTLAIVPSDQSEHRYLNLSKYQQEHQSPTVQTHYCGSRGFHNNILRCFDNETHLRVGFCATHDQDSDTASVALCPYFRPDVFHVTKYKGAHYLTLPENVSEINDYMCKPLNRKGRVCSKCMEGYGPAVMSVGFDIQCANCTGTWYGVPLFIFLELFPITIFYFIILIFRINITSGSITCYIMYSQLLIIGYDRIIAGDIFDITDILLTANNNSKLFVKILLTVYDIWNLRFFRYFIPPFCISSRLKPIHLVFLSYISVFYPLCLMAVTWVCIELYDRNFRPLVWLCRPFLRCFSRLRRSWNPKSDIINVFASFFLLSFCKVLFQLLFLLTYQKILNIVYTSGKYLGHDSIVMEYDLSVPYGKTEQLVFAIISVLFCCILNFLPTILLILYPFKCFRALLSKCRLDGIVLNTFVEKFNGCYKNGLDGGKDMRSFAGLYFAVRLMLFLSNAVPGGVLLISENDPYLLRHIIFTITAILVALCRPYKETYMNVLDMLLLAHLGIFCHFMSSYAGFHHKVIFVTAFEVMIALPFAVFVIFFLARALQKAYIKTRVLQMLFQKCKGLCCVLSIQNIHRHIIHSSDDGQMVQPIASEIEADYGSINIQRF